MNAVLRRMLQVTVPACAILAAGCGTTTIRSDLVLQPQGTARIELHQKTQAIELLNDSDADIRVLVLGKRDRLISKIQLSAHDQARLDLLPARALQFENESLEQGVVRWILSNDGRIEYSLALSPTTR